MTQEQKELLLKDLCARLNCGVICTDNRHGDSRVFYIDVEDESVYYTDFDEYGLIENCRPYLRPMSTMSSKERRELRQWGSLCMTENDVVEDVGVYGAIHSIPAIDWLNEHHFDYRGLIPMGLALPAPKDMYK